jgi:hypothetical protein
VQRKKHVDTQIDQSLRSAIHAFAAPWFLLVSQEYGLPTTQIQEIIRASWRAARHEMLKAINRTCYRSILALYLFAQTPVPVGLSENEELDGISGPVCIQTALCQLQRLRARKTGYQLGVPAPKASFGNTRNTPPCVDCESRAYWAAMNWDTASSLTLEFRTSLTSGLKGACSEPTWRLVKASLVGSFVTKTAQWHNEGFKPTNRIAEEIVSAASICKTYVWKNITSLKEAIREGVHDDGVLLAWQALLGAIDIFNNAIRPLLKSCEAQLHCLSQSFRLKWYQVNLQYFHGILLLVDTMEAGDRPDLLQEISAVKQDAERESFNVLTAGLANTYTIKGPMIAEVNRIIPRSNITATLVAIDPYPQYVVDCVILMHKSMHLGYRQDDRLSTLIQTLRQLPQSSKSVQIALAQVLTPGFAPTLSQ